MATALDRLDTDGRMRPGLGGNGTRLGGARDLAGPMSGAEGPLGRTEAMRSSAHRSTAAPST